MRLEPYRGPLDYKSSTLTARPQCLYYVDYFIFFPTRVHELFLYNDELKKSKFSFGHFISHKNSVTNQYDMKVRLYAGVKYMY